MLINQRKEREAKAAMERRKQSTTKSNRQSTNRASTRQFPNQASAATSNAPNRSLSSVSFMIGLVLAIFGLLLFVPAIVSGNVFFFIISSCLLCASVVLFVSGCFCKRSLVVNRIHQTDSASVHATSLVENPKRDDSTETNKHDAGNIPNANNTNPV